jgi:hypothetical protein
VVIAGNTISLNVPAGQKHSDGIQLWNVGSNKPSTDLLIEDNTILAENYQSHGIYMNNAKANAGGGSSTFFQDVVIRDNVIVTGDGLGLSWAQTNHLDITGNIVIRDPDLADSRTSPTIRVSQGATDVTVTGNVSHKAPGAANANWQSASTPGAWTINDNAIVPVGSSLAEARDALGGSGPDPNPGGETFRFDSAGPTDVVRDLDFAAGDRIVLFDYAAGTFKGGSSSSDGTTVTFTSLGDIRTVDAASSAIKIHEGSNDTIAIAISQTDENHAVRIVGLADDYF